MCLLRLVEPLHSSHDFFIGRVRPPFVALAVPCGPTRVRLDGKTWTRDPDDDADDTRDARRQLVHDAHDLDYRSHRAMEEAT